MPDLRSKEKNDDKTHSTLPHHKNQTWFVIEIWKRVNHDEINLVLTGRAVVMIFFFSLAFCCPSSIRFSYMIWTAIGILLFFNWFFWLKISFIWFLFPLKERRSATIPFARAFFLLREKNLNSKQKFRLGYYFFFTSPSSDLFVYWMVSCANTYLAWFLLIYSLYIYIYISIYLFIPSSLRYVFSIDCYYHYSYLKWSLSTSLNISLLTSLKPSPF